MQEGNQQILAANADGAQVVDRQLALLHRLVDQCEVKRFEVVLRKRGFRSFGDRERCSMCPESGAVAACMPVYRTSA
jgi:hypothetical protein